MSMILESHLAESPASGRCAFTINPRFSSWNTSSRVLQSYHVCLICSTELRKPRMCIVYLLHPRGCSQSGQRHIQSVEADVHQGGFTVAHGDFFHFFLNCLRCYRLTEWRRWRSNIYSIFYFNRASSPVCTCRWTAPWRSKTQTCFNWAAVTGPGL